MKTPPSPTPPGNPFAHLNLPELPPGPPETEKGAPDSPQRVWTMGSVTLQRETAHRSGKTVIVVKDFGTHLPVTVIEAIAKRIRSACGCGGSVKNKRIEIQGDQPARIRAVLEAEGFVVKGLKNGK